MPGLVKKTLHWNTTPDKFSSVTVSVIVLLLTTPCAVFVARPTMAVPSSLQVMALNVPAVSSEIFTEHVNSIVELIRAITFCGRVH